MRLAYRICVVCALALLVPFAARADQRADYMLTYERPGLYLYNDFFGTGLQTTLEHRRSIYGLTNSLTSRLQTRVTYPLGEIAVQEDIRILFLSIGGQLGYRYVWRNIHFAPDEPIDREQRRKRDAIFAGSTNSNIFAFAEAHASLIVPLNENLLIFSTGTVRWEGNQKRSFDWLYTVTHDPGIIGVWEGMLLFKSREYGGFGPYVQWLSYPLDGQRHEQWAYGFNGVRRLGLFKRNDLIFVTVLMRADENYGQHSYFLPVRGLITYRFGFEL